MKDINPTACVFPHLGKRQREVLLKMCEGVGVFIQAIHDDSSGSKKTQITLSDDDGNEFEALTEKFLIKLIALASHAKIFNWSTWHPSLEIEIEYWRIKPELIEETKLLLR